MRLLRQKYPELWALLLKWDNDAPDYAKFKPGRTVHDYERRFRLEEEGYFDIGVFSWDSLNEKQMNIYQFLRGANDAEKGEISTGSAAGKTAVRPQGVNGNPIDAR